jgi:hypothetical protein
VVDQQAETPKRRKRLLAPGWVEVPRPVEPGAEAGEHFLVEDGRRNTRRPGIDDESDRVRPDIDDRDRLGGLQA